MMKLPSKDFDITVTFEESWERPIDVYGTMKRHNVPVINSIPYEGYWYEPTEYRVNSILRHMGRDAGLASIESDIQEMFEGTMIAIMVVVSKAGIELVNTCEICTPWHENQGTQVLEDTAREYVDIASYEAQAQAIIDRLIV